MQDILQINQISKNYKHIWAVDQVSFSITNGEVWGILGPNGSGKTTTLGIILGIIQPVSGHFAWFGHMPNETYNKRIGALLETPNFYNYLTLVQNLRISARIKGIPQPIDQEIDRVLKVVNLFERRNGRFKTLSLGMKQRLSLASVLLGDPDVLVLDEPTNGLDPQGIAEVRGIIRQVAATGKTIILASHILDEVEKVCSHVAILRKGKLLADGQVSRLLGHSDLLITSSNQPDQLQKLLQSSGLFGETTRTDNDVILSVNSPKKAEEVNQYAFDNGIVLTKLEYRKKTLEAEFLEIISRADN